jgi:sterol desaturase/sphingolipid hydroxylase (fatty acid hydroxylase superfamily)
VIELLIVGPVKAFLIAAAVFVPFERLASLRPAQPTLRREWANDVFTGVMNGLLLYAALLILLGGIDAAAALCVPRLRQWVAAQSLVGQCLGALLIGDLGVYGIHRLQHTIPWLWRFHAVHHSAEELDWLIGFRFHPLDLFLLRVASLGPLLALNAAPSAVALFIAVSGWQSWLVHANVRMPYGPLRWLVVSPEFHHWHHSAEREAHDRNYASVLASWDILFGTLYLPRGRQPQRYGIEERLPESWMGRLVHPFRRRRPEVGSRAETSAECAKIPETAFSPSTNPSRRSSLRKAASSSGYPSQ